MKVALRTKPCRFALLDLDKEDFAGPITEQSRDSVSSRLHNYLGGYREKKIFLSLLLAQTLDGPPVPDPAVEHTQEL